MKPLSPEQIDKIMNESMERWEEEKNTQQQFKKGFFTKWKEGILNMTPEQQIKARITGLKGGILGLIMALTSLLYRKMWGFGVFVFFIIWIQVISWVSARQQLISTRELMSDLNAEEEDKNSAILDKELGNSR